MTAGGDFFGRRRGLPRRIVWVALPLIALLATLFVFGVLAPAAPTARAQAQPTPTIPALRGTYTPTAEDYRCEFRIKEKTERTVTFTVTGGRFAVCGVVISDVQPPEASKGLYSIEQFGRDSQGRLEGWVTIGYGPYRSYACFDNLESLNWICPRSVTLTGVGQRVTLTYTPPTLVSPPPSTPTPVRTPSPTPTPFPSGLRIVVNGARVMVPGDLDFAVQGMLPEGMDPDKATVTLEVDGRETHISKLGIFADKGWPFSTSGIILRMPEDKGFMLGPLATILGLPPQKPAPKLPQQLSVRAVLRGDGKVVATEPVVLTFVDWDGRLGQMAKEQEATVKEGLAWLADAQALGGESQALTPALQGALERYSLLVRKVVDVAYRFKAGCDEVVKGVRQMVGEMKFAIERFTQDFKDRSLGLLERLEQTAKESGFQPPFSIRETPGDEKKGAEYGAAFTTWWKGLSPAEQSRLASVLREPAGALLSQFVGGSNRALKYLEEKTKNLKDEVEALNKRTRSELAQALGPEEERKQLEKDLSAALDAWVDYTLRLLPLEAKAATLRDSLRQAHREVEALAGDLRQAATEPSVIGREEDYLSTADLLARWADFLGRSAEGVDAFLIRADRANEITARLALGDRTLHISLQDLFEDVYVSPAIALPQPPDRWPERVTKEASPGAAYTAVPAAAFNIPTLLLWRADIAYYPKYSQYQLSPEAQQSIRQQAEEAAKLGVSGLAASGAAGAKAVIQRPLANAVGGLDPQQEEGLASFYAADEAATQLAASPALPAAEAFLPMPVLEVALGSPAALLVADSEGRKTGFDTALGGPASEIPAAIYDGSPGETQRVLIAFPVGSYTVQLSGTAEGEYHLWTGYSYGGQLVVQTQTAAIQQGERIALDLRLDEQVEEGVVEGEHDLGPRLVLAPVMEAAAEERGWPLLWITVGVAAAALLLIGAGALLWRRALARRKP